MPRRRRRRHAIADYFHAAFTPSFIFAIEDYAFADFHYFHLLMLRFRFMLRFFVDERH
jgi:hypothetical protein